MFEHLYRAPIFQDSSEERALVGLNVICHFPCEHFPVIVNAEFRDGKFVYQTTEPDSEPIRDLQDGALVDSLMCQLIRLLEFLSRHNVRLGRIINRLRMRQGVLRIEDLGSFVMSKSNSFGISDYHNIVWILGVGMAKNQIQLKVITEKFPHVKRWLPFLNWLSGSLKRPQGVTHEEVLRSLNLQPLEVPERMNIYGPFEPQINGFVHQPMLERRFSMYPESKRTLEIASSQIPLLLSWVDRTSITSDQQLQALFGLFHFLVHNCVTSPDYQKDEAYFIDTLYQEMNHGLIKEYVNLIIRALAGRITYHVSING